ncbi:isocitrate lyase/PEP mutase family protein [Rhodococcus pseudokoreensis]|uniref:Isocitrate lyase/PEP mutase family protein n=1 Tax=Rhodococcus pseudokoreensis TaxID=2811421 RepID=A0A974W8V9_9NOCA|nr:isocitrate lyase/PEP mutase family protein [Rhodococcus pseudokoreensis]QSE92780.1 isocitrate lyase/PEP mutase family protein [Rhodococcus pseudokoreensis]
MQINELRQHLADGAVAAGVYDALSAKLAERAGFPAVFISGYALEASLLGAPDLGLLTMTEVLDQTRRVVHACGVPVICDIDTGFGGVNNVWRTVRELSRAGVSAVQLEDQVNPKRCPYIGGRVAAARGEAVARVATAVDASRDLGTMVIARTDADGISIDEVIDRCNLYLEAGAEAVIPLLMTADERPMRELNVDDQLAIHRRVVRSIEGPAVCVETPSGVRAQDMVDLGYSLVEMPLVGIEAAANALDEAYRSVLDDSQDPIRERLDPSGSLLDILGLPEYIDRETRFNSVMAQS